MAQGCQGVHRVQEIPFTPLTVQERGMEMADEETNAQLEGKSYHPKSLVRFFRESPLVGIDLDLERDTDDNRETDLPQDLREG